jgi:hypothetical protein
MQEGIKRKEYIQAVTEGYSSEAICNRFEKLRGTKNEERIDIALNNIGSGLCFESLLELQISEEEGKEIASLLGSLSMECAGGNEEGINRSVYDLAGYIKSLREV